MNEFTAFLQANIIPIYFIYGLAHFVTGLAVALESGRNTQLRLSYALPFLAAFGITHGINEWIEMFSMVSMHIPTLAQEPRWAEMIKLAWKAVSFFFLFEFGARLLSQLLPQNKRWLRWLSFAAVFVFLIGVVTMYMRARPAGYPQPGLVSMWTNYVLGIPASILAASAMLAQRRAFLRENMPQFGRDLVGAALALGWYALLDQVIDDPGFYFPANVLNTDAFLRAIGLPVELLRTVAVSALAFFVIRMLRVFEVEYARRLDAANKARFAAQEEATRELSVMFETVRILGTSLDTNTLLNDAITKIVTLLDPMIAGMVFLRDANRDVLTVRASCMREPAFALSPTENEQARLAAQNAYESQQIAYATEAASETSFVAVPLFAQARVVGALCLAHRAAFSNYAVIHTLARQLGIAIENSRLYAEVQEKEFLRGQLLERAVAAQEEERKRIARELHDETGQMLTALAVGLGGVENTIAQDPGKARAQIAELKTITMHTIDGLRQFVSDLRPTVLDDMGLVSALRWFSNQFAERTKLEINFEVVGAKRRLSSQVETVLFRIAQEALNNAWRHARATCASVRLEFSDSTVALMVQDNGCGFVVDSVLGRHSERRAWGLLGVQERVGLVGGTFKIDSAPERGTKLFVQVPVVEKG
ncbi:two-component system, NarL family, nitrate/nitrite sensor histidine kinase NarX [Anaerolineae bacterium]|nr:two-component system, NarL family, nitrate/nitrite sensor histidine kinase NarX [Anaerolineae bacterium]